MLGVKRSGVACVLSVLALGGCEGRAPLPQACIEAHPEDVLQVLARAPRDVTLADGTPISQCVRRAIDDGRLQALGATLTTAADRLARRMSSSDAAAYRLGFLIGATARGAAQAGGLQEELANRVAGTAGLDGGPRRVALLRGRAAGRRRG
jgi:hypothetical protein